MGVLVKGWFVSYGLVLLQSVDISVQVFCVRGILLGFITTGLQIDNLNLFRMDFFFFLSVFINCVIFTVWLRDLNFGVTY